MSTGLKANSDGSAAIQVGGSDVINLSTTGNAGLGITPSAWSGVGAALQVGTSAAIIGNNANSSSFISNAYFDGTNYRYIGTGFATRFATTSGAYSWNQAASGTAGNTITFTTAMTLDASGNLGLGVTPDNWSGLASNVFQTYAFAIAPLGANAVDYTQNAVGNGSGAYKYRSSFAASMYRQINSQHQWFIAPSGTAGNAITFTQAMTLDASGNLSAGTTSIASTGQTNGITAGTVIAVKGALAASSTDVGVLEYGSNVVTLRAFGATAGTGVIAFRTGGGGGTGDTERARIDASGFTQFNSNLVMPYQGAPTSKSTTATLTGAELITGILNTTGTTYTITLPTGTNIEGALTWSANNVSLDWYVINTASGTITIGANGNTTLGSLTIATGTSAHFRIRRTAANTFTVYRL